MTKTYSGPDALKRALHCARYGHRDWLVWRDRAGQPVAARLNPACLKQAMLATGTAGSINFVHAGGTLSFLPWPEAVTLYRNLRFLGC